MQTRSGDRDRPSAEGADHEQAEAANRTGQDQNGEGRTRGSRKRSAFSYGTDSEKQRYAKVPRVGPSTRGQRGRRQEEPRQQEQQWENRRRSYEMDVDEWTPITDEQQIAILVERLGVPREDLHSVLRSASILQITFTYGGILIEKQNLYKDIGDGGQDEGQFYPPHAVISNEIDPWRGPYWVTDYDREIARAASLSYKPIRDAPPGNRDLPWEKLLPRRREASIEEMLVYFPNHVAHWPGLALALRCQNWDRLFYRAARIINLARGSNQTPNREDLHTEVLPLQMKMQRAIQEIVPAYDQWDFNPIVALEMLPEVFYTRPKIMKQASGRVCTLQEAAGYIAGVNEFQDHGPFSGMMRQYQPNVKPVPTPTMPQTPTGLGDMGAYSAYKAARGDNFTGWPHEQKQPPFEVCLDDPCEDLDCKEHNRGARYKAGQEKTRQASSTEEPGQSNFHRQNNRPNNNTPETPRWYDTRSQEEYNSGQSNSPNNPTPYDGDVDMDATEECRDRTGCVNPDCEDGHRGPWTGTGVHLRLDTWCRNGPGGIDCTDRNCAKAHKSWAHLENGKGPRGNINNTNGPKQKAKWQERCRSDPSCSNRECWYGHRGPRTKPNVQLRFDEQPRCLFDLECTNASCDKAHSSPGHDGSVVLYTGDDNNGRGRSGGSGGNRDDGTERGRGGRGRSNNGRGRGGHRGGGGDGGGGNWEIVQSNGRGRGNHRGGQRSGGRGNRGNRHDYS